MNKVLRQLAIIISLWLLFSGVILLLNYRILANWSLSGDDLYLLTASIASPRSVLDALLHQWSGQYRHITSFALTAYKALIPDFQLIFLVHTILFATLPALLVFALDNRLSLWQKVLIALPILFSPIFFYHTFTISSLANVLMCIVTLLLLYYWKNRAKYTGVLSTLFFFGIALLSVAIKETFVLPLALFVVIQLSQFRLHRAQTVLSLIGVAGVMGIYVIMRLLGYSNDMTNAYYFDVSASRLTSTAAHWIAWMIGYPMGWQYGAPIRLPIVQPVLSLLYLGFYATVLNFGWMTDGRILAVFLGLSAAVFSLLGFLSQTHVFYLDLLFILFSVYFGSVVASLLSTKSKIANGMIISWLVLNIVSMLIIKPQWLEYSFVARAEESAQNFAKVLRENNAKTYQRICIINHDRGTFGTEDGNLANYMGIGTFDIESTSSAEVPNECLNSESLTLSNDVWSYSVYDTKN